MSAVADNYETLEELGVEAITVSVDSHFVHKMWHDQELTKMVEGGVPFPMASDQNGAIGQAYGVWDEDEGIEQRSHFIIDPDGKVQAIEIISAAVGRRFAEIRRQIQALQYVYSSKNAEATPAGWQPGQKALKPGPALVGKVWQEWDPSMDN